MKSGFWFINLPPEIRAAAFCVAAVFLCLVTPSSANHPQESNRSRPDPLRKDQVQPEQVQPEQVQPEQVQKDGARADQLITECRQLMLKSSFSEISDKAQEALALSRKIGDKVRESRSLIYVALGTFHAGRIEEAIEPFKQAATLAREAGEKRLESMALNSAGTLLMESGRSEEALYFFEQSLVLSREQKDQRNEAAVLRNLAHIYQTTREFSKADRLLQNCLELARALHDPTQERQALTALGTLEMSRGNFRAGLNYQLEALKLETPSTPQAAKYQLRNELGRAYLEVGDLQKSADAFEQALDMARSQKIPIAEAVSLGNLAHVQLSLGRTTESYESSSRALTILHRTGADPSNEAVFLLTQARAEAAMGKPGEALATLRTAMAQLERSRLFAVSTETARAELFASRADIFLYAIDLLVSQGRDAEALAVAESYHGRAFLESLVESRADLRRILPKHLLDQEDAILERISKVQRELWQENLPKDREQELRKDLDAAEGTLERFQLEVRHSNPQYAGIKQFKPLTTERVQSEVLDGQTALVEYVVGEGRSFAWLVSKNKISHAILPGRTELKRLVADYIKSLTSTTPGPAATRSIAGTKLQGRALFQILLQPFESELLAVRRLLIVPDNALAYLPFETLVVPARGSPRSSDQYLVERFGISYAASASALEAVTGVQHRPANRELIAFGDPVYRETDADKQRPTDQLSHDEERGLDLRRLPYTRREVMSIGALFPAEQREVLLGADANEQKAKTERLDQFRYVHFAAHGVVDEDNPARSGIILSLDGSDKDDGVLQMPEIMRLKLNADLVTLSACRTGLGKVVTGEGVLGLTRAFMYAGTPSVVASLWNVNDIATAELMTAFYRKLKAGVSKGEALRQAKLEMLKGKQLTWHQPYYWASFVLVGSPR